jgi:SAM-dependent methyltransferase
MASEPTRFRAAAQHYLLGRPHYADALIRRVAELCELRPRHRVLDLGCGPGQLAVAFAPFVGHVVALDPEPAMLCVAREHGSRVGRPVEFRQGSSGDVGPELGSFRLVAIGRAFHWMQREDALRRLDQVIEPGGAIALFGDDFPQVPDNRWCAAFEQLIDRYAAADAARAARRAPGWLRHAAVLLDSPFCSLERIAVIEHRRTPLERFVARALSLSSVSRELIGARVDDLTREVLETMAPHARGGLVTEVVESEALIARRKPDC